MTIALTARRKAIRLDAAHRSAMTRCVPLHLTLGPQQPPGNALTPFPIVQLSSNALLPVAATILFPQSTIPATPAAAKSP
jgi:hypothetical protein